jgi:hypothetical protein
MSSSKDSSNQADIDMTIARELIKLMIIALEKKDCHIASSVEEIGRALEKLGFFQSDEKVYLPFSTTNSDTLISDYIPEEQQGIVELEDEGSYKSDTKWGVPDIMDLEDFAIDFSDTDVLERYIRSSDFDKEAKLDRAKAKKFQAKRVAEDERASKSVEKQMKPIYDKIKEVEERNKKKFG